jgi:uncharacterized membrane protein YoaK (UPF0700 family)
MALARTLLLSAFVCAVCLVVTAIAIHDAAIDRNTPPSWYASSAALAAAILFAGDLLARLAELPIVRVAAAVVAGGLAANVAVSKVCGGVANVAPIGNWIYSPGDLAVASGLALLVLGSLLATRQIVAPSRY